MSVLLRFISEGVLSLKSKNVNIGVGSYLATDFISCSYQEPSEVRSVCQGGPDHPQAETGQD